jgi:ABC-2 type transport system ATP-binding protein
MTPAVETHGVAKQYGSLVALDNLTITVQPGEVLGVLGPNGAGKTTAVRVLTTILSPSRGSFAIDGIPHTQQTEIRRRIGVLPESAGYPGRQTGEEHLRYHARLYGHSRASARAVAQALLEEVGLSDRRRSLIATYSRGMRQRLGIARALVNDPHVVFLDEPTLGLDPAGQRQVLGNVRRIASERGAAVLLSTHLLAEVEENCSRVLILNRGRVVAEGTVSDVARRAAAPRSGRLHVPPEHAARAAAALTASRVVQDVGRADGQPGWLTVLFAPAGAHTENGSPNDAVRALLDAGVTLFSFELEGARLSDAFLAMTEGA